MTAQSNPPLPAHDEPIDEPGDSLMILPVRRIPFKKPEEEPALVFSHQEVLHAFAELLPHAEQVKKESFACINLQIPGAVILRSGPAASGAHFSVTLTFFAFSRLTTFTSSREALRRSSFFSFFSVSSAAPVVQAPLSASEERDG
jgi:hypothetical protein